MKDKERLIIWGVTGQAIALEEFLVENYIVDALIDNDQNVKSPFPDIQVYFKESGFLKWYSDKVQNYCFIVAIGGSKGKDRVSISNYLVENNLIPISAINQSANIAKNAKLGNGVQIMMGASIAAKCLIGNYVIVNTSASIDHECEIGDGCHIGPGAILAGGITIDRYTFIGAGSVILPNIKIGKECIVGAGSIVTKDIPNFGIVYGNPAKNKGQTNE